MQEALSNHPDVAECPDIGISDQLKGQVTISSADDIQHQILFDPGHGLEERLISEQFN